MIRCSCAFACTYLSGSSDKGDQGAQWRRTACRYHNFRHSLHYNLNHKFEPNVGLGCVGLDARWNGAAKQTRMARRTRPASATRAA